MTDWTTTVPAAWTKAAWSGTGTVTATVTATAAQPAPPPFNRPVMWAGPVTAMTATLPSIPAWWKSVATGWIITVPAALMKAA